MKTEPNSYVNRVVFYSRKIQRKFLYILLLQLIFFSLIFSSGFSKNLPDCVLNATGGSTGKTLILLQGLNSSAESIQDQENRWVYFMSEISSLYSNVVYFSYDSENPASYQTTDTFNSIWNNHVPLLHDLIESCQQIGVGYIDLMGHSMGGVVSIEYLKSYGLNGSQAGLVRHAITLDSPVNGAQRLAEGYLAFLPWPQTVFQSPAAQEMGGMYLTRSDLQPLNVEFAKRLREQGVEIRTLTNYHDIAIYPTDAIIAGSGNYYFLGRDYFSLDPAAFTGHNQIFNSSSARTDIHIILSTEPTSGIPPTPVPNPPPQSNSDSAKFISDLTLPDGIVVAPNQALTKTWRVQNTGSSTWGSGYKLVFISGEQMGAPVEVSVPTTAPGQTADLSIPLTTPSTAGNYVGKFQLRNPQGTFFGDILWVDLNVTTANPGGNITLFDITPPSPSEADSIHIVGRARYFSDFRSMRFVIGNEVHEMTNFVQIGDQVEISVDWNTASLPRGTYAIVFEVAKHGDPDWNSAERMVQSYTLIGTPAANNHPPDRPVLQSPYDWFLEDASGASASVQLCVHPASDPDGDPVQYYYEVKDQGGGVYANSGWVSSTCWSRNYDPNTYSWRVKSGDGTDESDWSTETWNFSVAKGGVYIGDHTIFSPNTNETHLCVFVTYDGIQGPNVYAWLNRAPDGSDSGEWRLLDHYGPNAGPDCTQPNYHGFWIRSPEYETGTHLLRISAVKPDSGANESKDTTYTIAYIRPSDVNLLAPATGTNNGTWWDDRTIHFEWSPSLRADSYTLRASTNANPWADPAPILEQTFGPGTTSYDHAFSQDYPQLYWSVRASNTTGNTDSGPNIWFGIDTVDPACAVDPLPAITYESVFQVNWSGTDDSAGVRSFDIQYLDSLRDEWQDWLSNASAAQPFDLFTGQPGHTYYFRCRSKDLAGNTGDFPQNADTSILIDPASRPLAPWWDPAYTVKRNLIIQNNMSSIELPAGYLIHQRFDNSTVPTAAEIYNASLSVVKCDDLRVTHDDSIELDRIVQTCSSSAIDIWFQIQAGIPAGGSDNTTHQLYFGNANASNPPNDRNEVFYPALDANHLRVFDMFEGSGTTISDATGNGSASLGPELTWVQNGKFGPAVHIPGDQTPEPRLAIYAGYGPQPSCNFTAELWLKRLSGHNYGGVLTNQEIGGPNPWRWSFQIHNEKLDLSVEGAGSGVQGTANLSDATYFNSFHHFAVTYNCTTGVAKFYIDGVLDATRTFQNGGLNPASAPLRIGNNAYNTQRIAGQVRGFALSNVIRTSFPYASFAQITTEPSIAAGSEVYPPASGSPDLTVLGLTTYPNPGGGVLVEAVVQNVGDQPTLNGIYVDLYLDTLPTGAGDYSGSLNFWINEPIPVNGTLTVTTILDDTSGGAFPVLGLLAPMQEITGTLYAQADSAGAVTEPDETNNIYSDGAGFCLAAADVYETDDDYLSATALTLGAPQTHNLDRPGDADWLSFSAQGGIAYNLSTANLDEAGDTYIYLYDIDGTTLLAENDDTNDALSSLLLWTAPTDGIYYLKVTHWNPNAGGCGTSYDVAVDYATTAQFGKTTPSNGATGVSTSPTLSWEASSGATGYEYCFDTTNDNACTSWVSTGTSTSANLTGLAAGATYYWQVRASNSGGTTYADDSSTAFWNFTTSSSSPAPLSKTTPVNRATDVSTDPTLIWGVSSGASSYEYCIDTTNNNACSTSWISTGTATSANLSGLAGNTTYYWQVRAMNAAGTTYANGSATAFWRFATGAGGGPPQPFDKTAPANGAIGVALNPTLSWGASAGATSYDYCLDTTNDNACSSSWTSTGTATSANLSGLTAGTTYYWHVRANNGNGTTYADGASTDFWSFTTTSGPPAAFGKSAPADGATGIATNPTLSWEISAGASSYDYCLDTSDDDACASWVSTGTATSVNLSGLSAGTTYYWQARASNASGTTYADGLATAFWGFTTQAAPPGPEPFDKTAPVDGATGVSTSPTLSWEASAGPAPLFETPEALLFSNGSLVTHPGGGGAGGADASAIQTALGMTVPGFNHSPASGYRVADDFTVPAGGWTLDDIVFFAYQNGSTTTSTINFLSLRIWDGVPGAGGNVIFGDTSTNFLTTSSFTNIYRVPDTGLAKTNRPIMASTAALGGLVLPAGTYWLDWQTGGTLASGPWAPPISILGTTVTGNGRLFNPSNSTWMPLMDGSNAQGLPFEIHGTGGGSALTYEYCLDTTDDACSNWTSAGSSTSANLSELAANTTYYWQVRASDANGTTYANGSPTAFWSFTTQGSLPGAFGRISPANRATGVSTSPSLIWGSSAGATSYEYCISTGSSTCTTWISVGNATSVNLSGLALNTTYFWHVRSVNASGTTYANGSATTFWRFTTQTSALTPN